MKKKFLILIISLVFILITPVYAEEINKTYANANDYVTVKEQINADSVIAGNIIDILGNIDGIGFIAGNKVTVNGTLEYAFVAGKDIEINGQIEKNIYAAGQTITFSKDSSINRDTNIAGENIILNGNFKRDINIGANNITIKDGTTIEGDITISCNKLDIENNVTINGSLKYNKNATNNIAKDTKITNIETYNQKEENQKTSKIINIVTNIINTIIVLLVISILFPKVIDKTFKIYKDNKYLKNIGIGLLILICTPIISMLLLISHIGIALGLILIALYMIAIYLSSIFASYTLGELFIKKYLKINTNNYIYGLIGLIAIKLLVLIPYIGILISLITTSLGLATIWNLIQTEEN